MIRLARVEASSTLRSRARYAKLTIAAVSSRMTSASAERRATVRARGRAWDRRGAKLARDGAAPLLTCPSVARGLEQVHDLRIAAVTRRAERARPEPGLPVAEVHPLARMLARSEPVGVAVIPGDRVLRRVVRQRSGKHLVGRAGRDSSVSS